jgi:hypothetical protein
MLQISGGARTAAQRVLAYVPCHGRSHDALTKQRLNPEALWLLT